MEAIFRALDGFKAQRGLQKIRAVPNKNYKRDGTKSYVSALNRYGFHPTKPGRYFRETRLHQRGLASGQVAVGGRARVHDRLVKKTSTSSDEKGEVTAEDQQNDSMYLCEVQIGTPAQTLRLDFDTGSSDLWVFSTELPTSDQSGHAVFNPAKSSTFKTSEGETWKISYGDGSSASGTVGTDVVTIGGLSIENQSVELATTLSTEFTEETGDGLLGLAFPTLNTITAANGEPDPQPTTVANMITQDDVPADAQLFTCALYSDRDTGADSFYTFGWVDQALVSASGAEIAWAEVDSTIGYWMFSSASATVAGSAVSQTGNQAIADTGTSLALVSDEVCEALYAQIEGATYNEEYQGYLIPDGASLPDFSVAIGSTQFTIQKEDLLFSSAGEGMWYGGVQSRGDNTFDILGDVFLKSVYAVWDQGNRRFGCVPKIEKTQHL